MVALEKTVRNTTKWALGRIHSLCDTDDPMLYFDAYAITKEFDEWLDPKIDDHDIYSLEYINGELEDLDDRG